ncbi:hypothetical protein ONZ51_g1188 [Trametes cubensis]|uniref:Fungal-type protein kinase domain-containing protein n=1 Tax=Trametes cubensis TaxID=1111947 RepID=A0AAD7XG05_9APHY|nr:hypothetical protein ONZ51_g1188 [Trametes cubensis]
MHSASPFYDAPMALDENLSGTYGLQPRLAMARLRRHVFNAKKHTLGPMPVERFIEEFLPPNSGDSSGRLSSRNAFRTVPQCVDVPARIYKPLVSALNKKTRHKARCPGFIFMNTAERSTRQSRAGHAKPDICCFTTANATLVRKADRTTRTELGYTELFIKVSPDPTADFFEDPPPTAAQDTSTSCDFLRDIADDTVYAEAEKAFGLSIAFAVEILARQQRAFLFSISMSGSLARLYRWDRAGCIVTQAFDVRERPELLTEFLWRFSALSDAERGFDTTIELASSAEEALFRDSIRKYVSSQLDITGEELNKAVFAHYQPGYVVAVHILEPPESEAVPTHRYLVSRPVVSPLHLTGRCTRGYWAVQVNTGRLAFLKDTWRPPSHTVTEGDTLLRLNDLGVRNVPELAAHGDVFDVRPGLANTTTSPVYQSTKTDVWTDEPWICAIDGEPVEVIALRHYRLVTYTVGYSLKSLRGTDELLRATYDAFIAMRDALAKDSRIHRDLSVGNIILVKRPGDATRSGYLIDWETSDRVDEQGKALHVGRAGTWAFMSIRMLDAEQELGKHTFQDDMEALLWVVLYCGLFYLPHNLSADQLTQLHDGLFESSRPVADKLQGGEGKLVNAACRFWTKQVHFGSAAFVEWLNTVMDYHSPPPELQAKYKGMWTAEKLEAYWRDFLQSHNDLERDNRSVHELLTSRYVEDVSTTSLLRSIAFSGKHSLDEYGDQPEPKKARLQEPQPSSPPQLPSSNLRRSARTRRAAPTGEKSSARPRASMRKS